MQRALEAPRRHPSSPSADDLSFEFFPPAAAEGIDRLVGTARRLSALSPRFVSMTYGAGGSTRQRSVEAVAAFVNDLSTPIAAHITCVAESRTVTDRTIDQFLDLGVERFVALRGDVPEGATIGNGYADAVALVKALARRGVRDISVACYPEVHPKAASPAADVAVLQEKFAAGATRAISQFFLDTSAFLRFRDRLAPVGLDRRIVPGVLVFENFARAAGFAARCGTGVPGRLKERFARWHDDPRASRAEALAFLVEQVAQLRANGASHIHFYVLNKADLALDLLDRPQACAWSRARSAT